MANLVVWSKPKGLIHRIVNWRPALKSPAYRTLEAELSVSQDELRASQETLSQIREKLSSRNEEFEKKTGELDNILSSLELPMVMVDRALRITKFNRAAHLLFNISNDDVGFPITQVRARFEIPFLNSKLLKVMEQGEPLHRKITDQQMGAFKQSIVPYKDARGNTSGAIISFSALSGITDGTDKTLESPALFRAAQRIANLGSFYWAVGTEEVFCSDQLHVICGQSAPQSAAKSTLTRFIELFSAEDRAVLRSEIATALQYKRGFSVQLRLQRQDSAERTVQMEAIYQKSSIDDRQTEVLMGIVRDVTDEISEVTAPVLAAKKNMISASANQNETGSVDVWVDGVGQPFLILNADGIIQTVNTSTETVFGYSKAELVGQSINNLLAATKTNTNWFRPAFKSSKVQKTVDMPLAGLTKMGRGVAMNVVVHAMPNGTLAATLTKQKQKIMAVETARVPTPVRTMPQIVVSHAEDGADYNILKQSFDAPLEIVENLATIITREAYGAVNDQYIRCGKQIVDRAGRLRSVLQSLETMKTLQSDKARLEDTLVEMRDVIADAVESHSDTAHAKQISLGVNIIPSMPDIWADRRAVAQILNGMMDYALEAAEEGAHITVSVDETVDAGLALTLNVGVTNFSDDQIADAFRGLDRVVGQSNATYTLDTAEAHERLASVQLKLARGYVLVLGGTLEISKNGTALDVKFMIPAKRVAWDMQESETQFRAAV